MDQQQFKVSTVGDQVSSVKPMVGRPLGPWRVATTMSNRELL